MGFSYRKSVAVGPFRFNLSGSGVGVSVGVPGFRIGSGPRGNYVHVGRGGFSYRQTIPSADPVPRGLTVSSLEEIESAGAASIVDSSSEQLLTEIREKRRAIALTPFAVIASLILLLMTASLPWWILAVLVAISAAAILAARHRDRIAKTVIILYDFEPAVGQAFQRFVEWAEAVASCERAWHIEAEGRVHDRKYHSGASQLVRRNRTTLSASAPPNVETNVPVLSLRAGRQTLYFLPDRLLVYDAASVGAISYATLDISCASQRFIEEGAAPRDATVVGQTWRYVNKSGGPDRRFNHNPQLPICLYDELSFRTASGLNEVFHISRSGIGEGFAAAVRALAAAPG